MILFDLLIWLGVIGYSLVLVVCVVASMFGLDDCPAGPPRGSRRRVGTNGRHPSDCLPVVLFPWVDQAGREARGIRHPDAPWRDKSQVGERIVDPRTVRHPLLLCPPSSCGGYPYAV
jgi:hypothetical protein